MNIIVVRTNFSVTDNQHLSKGGAMYIRWGRKTFSGNGTELVYWGKYFSRIQSSLLLMKFISF